MNKKSKRIALLTSGGDCPGMNACIRAVVRSGIHCGCEVVGVRRGYIGLINGDVIDMDLKSVGGIINLGGTILLTGRSKEFMALEGRKKAVEVLKKNKIDGLVVIGGDGSFRGAYELGKITDVKIVGVPGSIDNDIGGTDFSIGFDSAVNTALEAIDKIRDTATSHERLFLVEVMGRHTGHIAMAVGIAGGAEEILIPETVTDIEGLCRKLDEGVKRGKVSSIVVVAEGDEAGGAFDIAKKIKGQTNYETRVSVIGYQQRGGSPTVLDRMLGARMGSKAVEVLDKGETGKMIGIIGDEIVVGDLEDSWKKKRKVKDELLKLYKILAT